MLRFGIAAILLPVLVVLAAGILFGGKGSRTALSPYLPSGRDWASGGSSGVVEAGVAPVHPSVVGQDVADGWTSEIRASLAHDLVDARRKNGFGQRYDDLPPFNKEGLAALPTAGDMSAEQPWGEYSSPEAPAVPSPAPRPADAGFGERSSAGREQRGTSIAEPAMRPHLGEPAPRPDAATARRIAEIQNKLAALGYDPGPADGRFGSRTEAAIRKFRKDARLPDGLIDDRLVARIDAEARTRPPARRRELAAISPGAAPPQAESPRARSILGSVLGGFQRLLGRDFDSVRRPAELAAYCRTNTYTWVYDFGREAFVYCGNVAAAHVK